MNCNTLVIGSGIAGLWAALKAADHGDVIVLTKKEESESNTNYAQGGIAGVLAADDAPRLHLDDTLEAGAGLCHEDAVDVLVREGPDRIRELIDFGAHFTTIPGEKGETLALGREGGHSRRRIVHAKDLTGREVERALLTAVRLHPRITVLENHLALDLLISDGECRGAAALNRRTRESSVYQAKATVLASGGVGQVYPHTTNPAIATGDGVAIGWRAGAVLANLEFIQFHPTTLYHPDAQSFLISEAVRGEGGILKLSDGSTFMEKYHRLASLAPRDIVARAIDAEVKKRSEACAYLDVTHLGAARLEERFPHIVATCRQFGIDPATQWIPVVPAAHYSCGGVVTDLAGRTNIPRLYASGEVSCTGVHGANRLASNSLLEAVVFSERAAADIATLKPVKADELRYKAFGDEDSNGVEDLTRRLREEMWARVGIVRTDAGLAGASCVVGGILEEAEAMVARCRPSGALIELRNMAETAALIVKCASHRKESRGLHYNTDHPERVESERHDSVLDPAREAL
ncbi:MAG TPA: L-aspartate oxidase [Armatimonadota bacterium]|jgi:L-aspartate oxidase